MLHHLLIKLTEERSIKAKIKDANQKTQMVRGLNISIFTLNEIRLYPCVFTLVFNLRPITKYSYMSFISATKTQSQRKAEKNGNEERILCKDVIN